MNQKIDVLDKGYVRLRGHMGDDLTVVDSARVSFDKKSEWGYDRDVVGHEPKSSVWGDAPIYKTTKCMKEKDKKLLRYLAREGHWSPFSHPHIMLEVKAPVMVVNQWRQHEVGSRFTGGTFWPTMGEITDDPWNEMSGRYVSEDLEFYVPTEWRAAPANRKQGSDGFIENFGSLVTMKLNWTVKQALFRYQGALSNGVAPEQARLFLPYAAMYTKLMWTPSLYRVLAFLALREDPHAQYEIRQYAEAVRELVQPLFPESFSAFEEVSNA